MGQYRADPKYIHKNVPCIQLAARRGNVTLLHLILSDSPELIADAMPKESKVEIPVPCEESYIPHRQSDASFLGENYQPRRNSNLGLSSKKVRDRLKYKRLSKRPTLDEEDRDPTIQIEYTHLSTPLHQTTLMNDVPMTKILVETYKVS